MAIQFARLQYVKRSSGQNACHKSAYNARSKIDCDRTNNVYNFSNKKDQAYHNILLPEGAPEDLKDPGVLWNRVEAREVRKDAQVAKEIVLALPDDQQVSLDDKVAITKSFIEQNFVSKGLVCQIDIHAPHHTSNKNWHAHVLMTTRPLTPEGNFGPKARDLDVDVRFGRVMSSDKQWGKLWAQHQNAYFKEHGIGVQVDPTGIVPQIHVGPVRMRGRAFYLIAQNEQLKRENEEAFKDENAILKHLLKNDSTFDRQEFERFLNTHVLEKYHEFVRDRFWAQKDLVLVEGDRYTAKFVKEEEMKLMRLATRVYDCPQKDLSSEKDGSVLDHVLEPCGMSCVKGVAGSGKSHLMHEARQAYEEQGYRVWGLSPTSCVADIMRNKGFKQAKSIHAFLFHNNVGRDPIQKRDVLIVDEASMISNDVFVELFDQAWRNQCKVILVGDDKQLPPVGRGGGFDAICNRYGSVSLDEVLRQTKDYQKELTTHLAQGDIKESLDIMEAHGMIHYGQKEIDVAKALIEKWHDDFVTYPCDTSFILTHSNDAALVLNSAVHDILMQKKEIGQEEVYIRTDLGMESFSEGDRVLFRKNNKALGIVNGMSGIIEKASEELFVVATQDGGQVAFNPEKYNSVQLGYAGTIHKAQGATYDRIYVLHSQDMDRNLFYVACTRHRVSLDYFACDAKPLRDQIDKDGSKHMTQEYDKISVGMWSYVRDRFYKNHDFYNQLERSDDKRLDILITDQERDGFICISPEKIDHRFKGADVFIEKEFTHYEYMLRACEVHSCTILNHDDCVLIGKGDRFYKAYADSDLDINKGVFMDRLNAIESRDGVHSISQALDILERNERELRPDLQKQYKDKHLVTQILYFQERTGSMPDESKISAMKEKLDLTKSITKDEYERFKAVSSTLEQNRQKTIETCIENRTIENTRNYERSL